jgi:hypothetical protein
MDGPLQVIRAGMEQARGPLVDCAGQHSRERVYERDADGNMSDYLKCARSGRKAIVLEFRFPGNISCPN